MRVIRNYMKDLPMDIEKKLSSSLADVISYEKKKVNKSKIKGEIGLNKEQVNGKKSKRKMTSYQGQQKRENQLNIWKFSGKRQSVQQLRASGNERNRPKRRETRIMMQERAPGAKRTNDWRQNKVSLPTTNGVEKKRFQASPHNVIQKKRSLKNLKTFSNTTVPLESFDSLTPLGLSSASKETFPTTSVLSWHQMNRKLNLVDQPKSSENQMIFSQFPTWTTSNDFASLLKNFSFRSPHNVPCFQNTSFTPLSFSSKKMLSKQHLFPQVLPNPLHHLKRKKRFNSSFNTSLPFLKSGFGINTRKPISRNLFS
ncbi:uncharacterized protein LOC128883054 [Hylaeus volcanicus]|uniref:uncharacterized protein LOC128883054 n=1 Tax=Hylaeus volcanicus TaxID=313075 RepID=UPI0023B8573C|nr:uncharacterized protein LOC128883054 [Hylaeus volcanicus]